MSTERYDVVVVGSGGAGLVAACVASDRGARVLVLEATDLLGGTTALSGGQLWIPNTAAMARAGYPDSAEDALTYLRRVTMGTGTEDHLTAFLEAGPRLADYLENDLGIPLQAIARDDYHPDWAGARFGRSAGTAACAHHWGGGAACATAHLTHPGTTHQHRIPVRDQRRYTAAPSAEGHPHPGLRPGRGPGRCRCRPR